MILSKTNKQKQTKNKKKKTHRNRSWPRKADLVFPGGNWERVGWMGIWGDYLDANCYIWNEWAMGPYYAARGNVCDWVTLL